MSMATAKIPVYCCNCTDLYLCRSLFVMVRLVALMVWVCLIEKMTYGQRKSEIDSLI